MRQQRGRVAATPMASRLSRSASSTHELLCVRRTHQPCLSFQSTPRFPRFSTDARLSLQFSFILPSIRPQSQRSFTSSWKRHYCSAAEEETKKPKKDSIKTLLNRFYLLVHPDLFSAHPTEQTANGKSLQLLLAFIDDMKKPERRVNTKSYELDFYLKQHQEVEAPTITTPSTTTTEDDKKKLHHTKITFKKVSFKLSLAVSGKHSRGDHFIKQLAPLFELCGLSQKDTRLSASDVLGEKKKKKRRPNGNNEGGGAPSNSTNMGIDWEEVRKHSREAWEDQDNWDSWDETPAQRQKRREENQRRRERQQQRGGRDEEETSQQGRDEDDDEDDGEDYDGDDDDDLFYTIEHVLQFLSQNIQSAKLRQEQIRKVEREVGLNRMAIATVQKGLRITFGRKELQSPEIQLQVTTRLVKVIQELTGKGKDLTNCTICFAEIDESRPGPGLYDDAFGRIFLNSLDKEGASWLKTLEQVNLAMVADKQEKLRMIRAREGTLAQRFGFRVFCADYAKIRPVHYVAFLERLLAESAAYIAKRTEVDLVRERAWNHANISVIVKDAEAPFAIDQSVGLLSIPSTATCEQLIGWIDTYAAKHATAHRFIADLRERETQLRVLVKRRLRLLDLQKADSISNEDMTSACFSLRRYSNTLAPMLQGLSVVVSDQFGIQNLDGAINLPHNFK